MKSTGIAYLFWCLGWIPGLTGLHRFYLGKYGTGILYIVTYGFVGIGQIIDLFRIPSMVEYENMKWQLRQGSTVNINIQGYPGHQIAGEQSQQNQSYQPLPDRTSHKDQPLPLSPEKKLENTILKLARQFKGRLTPLELAANSSLSLDEADKALQDFVRKGYANMTVTDVGNIIYEFPGFLEFDSSYPKEINGDNAA